MAEQRDSAPARGATEQTPSIPYYFSWINNTNEGSTERQTLIDLDFFRYMKETYGMQIRIYAWDAGNFDGAADGYGDLKGEKFRSQYPNGYRPVVEAAEKLGIRLGLWGSPDGFGDTPESERERFDFFVHLCRDYHFAAFKLDGVCGTLRPEKAHVYAKMIEECRRYSPDLLLVNHRLAFYEAQKYITTFLWNGEESYTDVSTCNRITAMHNRAYLFFRGLVEDGNGRLLRLAEDHGVCLSSCMDYFEDELIYQAFGRCLIMAPEIYGNPWLLHDSELPRLARIYNLHGRHAPLLVNGFRLPEAFGANAVSRGNGRHRFITTGNPTWEPKTVRLPLDETLGLTGIDRVRAIVRHPYEEYLGNFAFGDALSLPLPPFRAVLLELAAPEAADPVLTNCRYETVKEAPSGAPVCVRLAQTAGGTVSLLTGDAQTPALSDVPAADLCERAPRRLGALTRLPRVPDNAEQLYETAMFAADNDSLEIRSLRRAGPTAIKEVQAARDAFFAQETYRLRGCEAAAMFSDDPHTFFDGHSRTYQGGTRVEGGCLRVDFGRIAEADTVEFEVFFADAPTEEVPPALLPASVETSCDLSLWQKSAAMQRCTIESETVKIVKFRVHTLYDLPGKWLRLRYPVQGALRYLRVPEPFDRIRRVRLMKDGREVKPVAPRANNLQAPYAKRVPAAVYSGVLRLPVFAPGSFLAVAVNGEHGLECAVAVAAINGALVGANRRAPSFRSNQWEHRVVGTAANNTFFFDLPQGAAGGQAELFVLLSDPAHTDVSIDVYLCDRHLNPAPAPIELKCEAATDPMR